MRPRPSRINKYGDPENIEKPIEFHGFFCGGLGGIFEAKRVQDEPNTAVDGNKMSPRRRQNGLRWLQAALETRPGAPKFVFISEIAKE